MTRRRSKNRKNSTAANAASLKNGSPIHASLPSGPFYQRPWFLASILFLITAALYSPALGHLFVNYDDQAYIVENDHVRAGIALSTIRWALTATEESNWHPLTWISHALDCEFFGLNPTGHHGTSVAVHALNAAFLFLLLLSATGKRWSSLVVAALFALHPLNVESVAWAAERKNVLSMLFCFATLAAYGWYARKPGIARYVMVAFLFAVGLAAKPMIVTLPCALLLLDYWPLRRVKPSFVDAGDRPLPQHRWSWLLLEKIPLFALSAASSAITLYAQRQSMPSTEALPFSHRFGNAIHSYAMYLWKTFWPTHLAAFYPHEGARLAVGQVLLRFVVLVAITGLVWSQRRARPYLLVGWFWFLGNLVPVIGIVQVGDQAMADRYVYFPLIGIFVMLVWGISDLATAMLHEQSVRPLAASAAVILLVLSFLTVRQIGTWRSSNDLWSHALEVTKDNYVAEDYIGSALLVETYESTGQRYSDEATAHFRNALRINPHDAIGHLNVGADDHEHGRLQEAIEHYSEMLKCTNDTHLQAKAYIALGAAYGQLHAFDQAERAYQMAIKLEPGNRGLFVHLGQLELEHKIAQLTDNVTAHPTAQDYVVLGQLQQSVGRPTDARKSFEQALKLDPKSGDARSGLANVAQ
jgi:Tfp pilus assembly protein PilF